MVFWWPLLLIAFTFAICRFLLMLIPTNVLCIDVDASDGVLLIRVSSHDTGKTMADASYDYM
ncbi:hypothetical protein LguiA_031264 [Lonicera macranthoides]